MNSKIIFIGTPSFGAIILEKLIKDNFKPFLVITETDKPVGREKIVTPPAVKILAEKYNIPVVQPEKISDFTNEIKKLNPDLIILVAYGQIIPKEILDIPKYGAINVHPSLLPKYRGASPIQFAILNGEQKTGVTIMRMTEKLDVGPILYQEEFSISDNETFESLHNKLAEFGANILVKSLPKLFEGKLPAQNQDDSKATYTKIFKKEDGKIDWRKTAIEISRQIRALNPWPGTFTTLEGKNLKIMEALASNYHENKKPGQIFLVNNELAVATGQNSLILQKLQIEGKKSTTSQDFLRGHKEILGKILI